MKNPNLTPDHDGLIAEKVHTVGAPWPKRGAPTGADRARAFDKVNARTGKRPDRSFLKNYNPSKGKYHAIEYSDEEDFIMVLVMGDGKEFSYGNGKDPHTAYYGVNVLFFPDGKIDADFNDPTSKAQWHKDKEKIIKVAADSLKDKDLPGIYDGLGGVSNKRGTGELSFKVKNEGKVTFKQFLIHEASDAKRLAKQNPEAILKAKAEVAKARKSGDMVALAKAKKKLASLTEGDTP